MTNLLLVLVLVLLVPVFAVSVAQGIRMWKKEAERVSDARVQAAMDEAAAAEAEQGRRMDDGFNALMTYSVKLGRGRATGGEP